MKTLKLGIKKCSDIEVIETAQKNYSYAFRKLYKNPQIMTDSKLSAELCAKYSLSSHDYLYLKNDIEDRLSATAELKAINAENFVIYTKQLKELFEAEPKDK